MYLGDAQIWNIPVIDTLLFYIQHQMLAAQRLLVTEEVVGALV